MIANNGMARKWGPWLLVTAAVVGVAPAPFTTPVDAWWVVPTVAFQLVVYAAGFTLLRVPEHRRNATHLILVGVFTGAGYLEAEPIAGVGYWLQLGIVAQWLMVPLFLRVLLSYPAPGPRSRSAIVLLRVTWVWAVVPWLVSVVLWNPDRAQVPYSSRWMTLMDFRPGALIATYIGSAGAIVVGIWAVHVMWRRWRSAKGPLAPRSRLVAAAGILLAVGVGSREVARFLVQINLISAEGRSWIGIGHTVLAIAAVLLTGGSVYWSFAQRPRVVETMVATAGDPLGVEAALRRVLGDPTAHLYYNLAGTWLDARGAPASPASAPGRVLKVLNNAQGQPSALADLDIAVLDDPIQTSIALSATQMVLQAAHLAVERDAYAKDLSESRKRIVTDGVTQRIELERALHDGVQQHLLAVSTTLSLAQLASNLTESTDVIGQAQNQLKEALAELRRLARGIHPVALGHGGLPGGLRIMVDRWDDCELLLESSESSFACLDETVRTTCYFAAAEALANAIKYGSAPVSVTAACDGQQVTVTVVDRGAGGARPIPGGGLAGLRDRLAAVGGRVTITSPEGGPTMIEIRSTVHASTTVGAS